MGTVTTCTCDVCGKSINDADLLADATLRRIRVNGIWCSRQQQPPPASMSTSDDPVVAHEVLGSNDATDPEIFCSYAHASQWFSQQTY